MKKDIAVLAQAYYGNLTGTIVNVEDVDRLILGYPSELFYDKEKIDRTIIKVPNTDNLVILYNKYQEEERLKDKEEYFKEDAYVLKPLATIPELNLDIYSRCIACRMNENGELESLESEDFEVIKKYFIY